jgi:hypothetical protein
MVPRIRRIVTRTKYAAIGAAIGAGLGGILGTNTASTGGAVGGLVGATIGEKRETVDSFVNNVRSEDQKEGGRSPREYLTAARPSRLRR